MTKLLAPLGDFAIMSKNWS